MNLAQANNLRCETCAYWQPPRSSLPGGDLGQCRRHAPVVYRTDAGLRGMWPTVLGHNWCGDHTVVPSPDAPW
jgi:hypothetical protein